MTTPYRTRDLSRLSVSDLRSFVGSAWSRKLAQNTWVEQLPHAELAIRFHATRILVFSPDGSFLVNSGGYRTVTTKQRLNALMPSGYSVWQKSYRWYISTPEGEYPFEDGVRWGGYSRPTDMPAPSREFEDVYYGDVKAGNYVYDRHVSRFVRVVETVERNAVDVELHLWGGDVLVAPCDTLIARKLYTCRFPHNPWSWCGTGCVNSAPDGSFETADEKRAREAKPVGEMVLGPNGFDLHLSGEEVAR